MRNTETKYIKERDSCVEARVSLCMCEKKMFVQPKTKEKFIFFKPNDLFFKDRDIFQ